MAEESPTWPSLFSVLTNPETELSPDLVAWAMTEILQERATEAQTAALMVGLKLRGETAEQVSALAGVMLDQANVVPPTHGFPVVLDIVGTGGDSSHSVNISTMAAIVAAACGTPVIKHGNRAVSSSTGAADLLEELGVVIDLDAQSVADVAGESGIGFCFAPRHHPAMRFAAPARKQIGIPTVFNILGPLTNPAMAHAGLIGCANIAMAPIMAEVLRARGVCALVVRGEDGLDEISLSAPTHIWDATSTEVIESVFSPADVGIAEFDSALLRGGDRVRNAELTRKVLGGLPAGADSEQVDAIRLAVAVNAAAALVAASSVGAENADSRPVPERIRDFIPAAHAVLLDGTAWDVLTRWAEISQRVDRT
ncbi:MAG: anthranilate phosphoribosyltransferase [Candidatus Nanopelagicales bacterium]|nr:anthranilate phosphoribosyltransferase [Candidatus Nanopelagicales bacterium]